MRIWIVAAALGCLFCHPVGRLAADTPVGHGLVTDPLTQITASINHGRYDSAISQINAALNPATLDPAALNPATEPDRGLIYLRGYAQWKLGGLSGAQKDFSRLGDFVIAPEWPAASDYVRRIQDIKALAPHRVREVRSGSTIVFRVYYDENNAWTRGIVDLLPRAYNVGRKLLSIEAAGAAETTVFVFKDRSRLDAFTRVQSGRRLPAGVMAAASNGMLLFCQYDARGLQPAPDTASDVFRGTVAHEYTHCLMQRALGTTALPLWLDEGLAMVAASKLAPHDLRRNDYAIHRLLEKNAIMSLDELGEFYDSVEQGLRKGEGKTDPYQQGFHMTRYLLSRMKPGELAKFLDAVLKTGNVETAFRRHQGLSLAGFYNAWLHDAQNTTRLTATVTGP